MRRRPLASVFAVAFGSLSGLIPFHARAQAKPTGLKETNAQDSVAGAPDKPYDWRASFAQYKVAKIPRMADGRPDLQGIWSRNISTPLQRPANQKNSEITQAEAEKSRDAAHSRAVNVRIAPTDTPPGEKTTDAYNTFWRENWKCSGPGHCVWVQTPVTSLRTSQVVDPPDGQVPLFTEAAEARLTRYAILDNIPPRGPEDRPLASRCVRPLGVGPAYTGGGMGETFFLVQNKDEIVIHPEALETQRIYLDGRALPPDSVRLDQGASRGHWEGDVLVVETTNFTDGGTRDGSPQMHLEERWKRLDDTHLLYGFTMDDPGTWVRPWSVELVMWRMTDQEQLVEYACHEGNVGIEFSLSAARAKEDEEARKQAHEAK